MFYNHLPGKYQSMNLQIFAKSLLIALIIACLTGGCNQSLQAVKMPAVDELPVIDGLPDPFLRQNGSRVKTASDWEKRRQEIKAMLLHYQYGHMPPAPKTISAIELSSEPVYDGTAEKKHILLTMGPENSIPINLGLIIPKGSGPFPVILKNDRRIFQVPIAEEIISRGYIVADYARTDLDPDENGVVGSAQAAYPDYDWATLAVWAWGGMRVIDYLVTLDAVDRDKIVFTGQSRGGKTALLAGALDQRIAVTAPNGSGCGGAGSYRVLGKKPETLDDITKPSRFSYWFHPRLKEFVGRENQMPFDQHYLKALVAPRALISLDALGDLWANPLGTQQTYRAAQEVFDFLNAANQNGIHFRTGGHAQNEQDWRALLDFADKMLLGKNVPRQFDKLPFPEVPISHTWTAPTMK